ncbi:hypothetical protein [Agrococcus sp. SCSIO52902]|uniref:hypothetical protein n=1 Tax=Agrococcus sp. SCSIO52902 TaxID=2933290 RepID=UPI001FF2DC59|nr:hypothetical protein [Agrococcus sp. SCSIO52902]UOW01260.1 hypothetical protein MU522_02195 [Agrococcus sp. SCSIO52902]
MVGTPDREPLWRRGYEALHLALEAVAGLFAEAIEDGARRIHARVHTKRNRVFSATRGP